jgi:hypothetical protein
MNLNGMETINIGVLITNPLHRAGVDSFLYEKRRVIYLLDGRLKKRLCSCCIFFTFLHYKFSQAQYIHHTNVQ